MWTKTMQFNCPHLLPNWTGRVATLCPHVSVFCCPDCYEETQNSDAYCSLCVAEGIAEEWRKSRGAARERVHAMQANDASRPYRELLGDACDAKDCLNAGEIASALKTHWCSAHAARAQLLDNAEARTWPKLVSVRGLFSVFGPQDWLKAVMERSTADVAALFDALRKL